jgi:hypothetical protein
LPTLIPQAVCATSDGLRERSQAKLPNSSAE